MPRKTKDTKIEIKEDKIVGTSISLPKSKANSNSDVKKASSSKKSSSPEKAKTRTTNGGPYK